MSDAGLALFLERCARVPAELASFLSEPFDPPPLGPDPVVLTGLGCSEGPARLLASLLQRQGRAARFAPASAFANNPPAARSLVLFSQGLSPNARLVLSQRRRYESALLFTGLSAGDEALAPHTGPGLSLCALPPRHERGLLVRLLGTATATAAALRAAAGPAPAALLGALQAATGRASPGPLPEGPVALLAAGEYAEACSGLRWRMMEGLLCADIHLWDALAVAHGPFQCTHGAPLTLLALEHDATSRLLTDRLASMLAPGHRLLRLPATLPEPWCLLEHLLALDALMAATLASRPRPLDPWPGKGDDAPLYGLDEPPG